MNGLIGHASGSLVGLTFANFIFQMLSGSPDFLEAAERSFFQFIALLTVVLVMKLSNQKTVAKK
jgi:hypothetical protein